MRDASASGPSAERELTIEALANLREKTETIATLLCKRLTEQLETLRPIFAPRRMLGRHVRTAARDEVPGAERAFARLKERYALTCGRPFSLPKDLEDEPLSIEPIVDLYPFEYRHALEGNGARSVVMRNPMCWTLSYRSGYTLPELEAALQNRTSLRPGDAKQFLINSLAIQLLFETFPEITQLLEELRYDVRIERRPQLGELPLVTVRAPLAAFRPSDAVIASAIRFSGVPAFIELIDVDDLPELRDPLRERIESAIG